MGEPNVSILEEFLCKSVETDTPSEEIQALYDRWAETYEEDLLSHGYVGSKSSADYFTKYIDKYSLGRQLRILDVGCGPGLVGVELNKKGFTNIDALDISEEMLKVAASKNVYRDFLASSIGNGDTVNIACNSYDAITCIGSFIPGHIKEHALKEFVRLVRKGGIIHFSVRLSALSLTEVGYNYTQAINDLLSKGLVELIAKDEAPYYYDQRVIDEHEDYRMCCLFTFIVTK